MHTRRRCRSLPIKGRPTQDFSCLISRYSPLGRLDPHRVFQQINLEHCASQSLESNPRRAARMSSRQDSTSVPIAKKHTILPHTKEHESYPSRAFWIISTVFIRGWIEIFSVLEYPCATKTLPERFRSLWFGLTFRCTKH